MTATGSTLRGIVTDALRAYEMRHATYDDGGAYRLADALSIGVETIATGLDEIDGIADAVADAIAAAVLRGEVSPGGGERGLSISSPTATARRRIASAGIGQCPRRSDRW